MGKRESAVLSSRSNRVVTNVGVFRACSLYTLRCFTLAVLLELGGFSMVAAQTPDVTDSDVQQFNYVMSGFRANRFSLRTGSFRAYGRFTRATSRNTNADVEYFCAFDLPAEQLRWDYIETSGKEQFNSKVIFGPKETLSLTKGHATQPLLEVFKPGDKRLKGRRGMAFDPRALGLYYIEEFDLCISLEDLLTNRLPKWKLYSINHETNGLWKIVLFEFVPSIAARTHTLWLDEAKGFTLVRRETTGVAPITHVSATSIIGLLSTPMGQASLCGASLAAPQNIRNNLHDGPEPILASEASWEERSGVWVPKTMAIRRYTMRNQLSTYDLAFEWELVNKKIPNQVFTKEGLEIKDTTPVYDRTVGAPKLVEVLNLPERLGGPQPAAATPPTATLTRWLLINGIVAVLVMGFISVWYWRKRPSKR